MKKSLIFFLLLYFAASSFAFNLGPTGEINGLPYIIYNSTNGLYYGVIGKGQNFFDKQESLSVSAYLISNGGNGVYFDFALPDENSRHGKAYGLAFDLTGAIGKAVSERYYGLGSGTPGTGYTTLDNTHNKLNFQFSKSISRLLVGEVGLFLASNHYSNIVQGVNPITKAMQATAWNYAGASFKFTLDRRDQALNPRTGIYAISKLDFGLSNCKYVKAGLDLRSYSTPFAADQILASRFQLAQAVGENIPLYEYPFLGDKDTMRGYTMSRWRDKASALINLEYRFLLFYDWIQAVTFYETGKVGSTLGQIGINDWASDYGAGLRLILGESVVVRGDFGLGAEGMNACFFYDQAF